MFFDTEQLSLIKFFNSISPSMRKVDNGEKKEKKKEKIMTFIMATNVVARRPPECRPTGTPHAPANYYWKNAYTNMYLDL